MSATKIKSIRGKDRAKGLQGIPWKNGELVGEFDKDYTFWFLYTQTDLSTLGSLMGHCAGDHAGWAKERVFYFFAVCDETGAPRGTLHAKATEWLNKRHPSDGRYRYRSGGYDYGAKSDSGNPSWDNLYIDPFNSASAFVYPRAPKGRPAEVDPELFADFQRCWKAMKDQYNKKVGNFKIAGRRFNFDGQDLTVLSLANRSQTASNSEIRCWVRDWLNAHQKFSPKIERVEG